MIQYSVFVGGGGFALATIIWAMPSARAGIASLLNRLRRFRPSGAHPYHFGETA